MLKMPPRLRLRSLGQLADVQLWRPAYICSSCQYATARATTSASTDLQMPASMPQLARYPPSQPPSHRDPKYRKSQLLRSYVSLLQTTPLIILFQHNNLKAMEWAGIRRELATALQKADQQLLAQGSDPANLIGRHVKLQIVQTNMFAPALRIAEYYRPSNLAPDLVGGALGIQTDNADLSLTHALSEAAYRVSQSHKNIHPLTPLLSGSIAVLTFPTVSPQYVKAALSILAPQPPTFPAPTRRAVPSYHEPPVQDGLKKLMLLGARIDGQVFDTDGTRWVGSIDGGIDGLRAQLVALLQGFGAALTSTLESASRSLWFTMEGRRTMLEKEANPEAADAQQS